MACLIYYLLVFFSFNRRLSVCPYPLVGRRLRHHNARPGGHSARVPVVVAGVRRGGDPHADPAAAVAHLPPPDRRPRDGHFRYF